VTAVASLFPLIIAAGIAFLLVHYTAIKAWHVIAGILLGVFLTRTALGPDLAQVVSAISTYVPGMKLCPDQPNQHRPLRPLSASTARPWCGPGSSSVPG
jgi:hypothetical protein